MNKRYLDIDSTYRDRDTYPDPGNFIFTNTRGMVSHQQMICYEIELVSLILPNLPLVNQGHYNGKYIYELPYVWVELSNVTSPMSGTNVIYSNNPNSRRMLFKCSIDNNPNTVVPFLTLNGDGMTQTVKFAPNDNLRFSVRLPDGDVLKNDTTTDPPTPLQDIQISALFSIKRL